MALRTSFRIKVNGFRVTYFLNLIWDFMNTKKLLSSIVYYDNNYDKENTYLIIQKSKN